MTYVENLTGEMVMLPKVGSKKPFANITKSGSLLEVLEHTENYCKNCETVSPMICVERCDVWKVKNEILEIRRIVNQKDHTIRLLNALKNERRLEILRALMEHSCSSFRLQGYLTRVYQESQRDFEKAD